MADKRDNSRNPTQDSLLGWLDPGAYPASALASPTSAAVARNQKQTPKADPVPGDGIAAKAKPAENLNEKAKPEQGMDLLTWYMLTRESHASEDQESDSDFAKGFKKLVHAMGLDKEVVTINGQKTTMGELANRMASGIDGSTYGSPQGTMSRYHLSPNSPASAATLGTARARASANGVLDDIQRACAATGANFNSMLMIANQESGFRPGVKSKTSSATGLYQFLDDTWERMATRFKGTLERQGLHYSNHAEMMALRTNPFANALMGGELLIDNQRYLEKNIRIPGYQASAGDIYMANFLGQAGARRFIEAMHDNPNQSAESFFSRSVVRANYSVMHDRNLSEVAAFMASKISGPNHGSPAPAYV